MALSTTPCHVICNIVIAIIVFHLRIICSHCRNRKIKFQLKAFFLSLFRCGLFNRRFLNYGFLSRGCFHQRLFNHRLFNHGFFSHRRFNYGFFNHGFFHHCFLNHGRFDHRLFLRDLCSNRFLCSGFLLPESIQPLFQINILGCKELLQHLQLLCGHTVKISTQCFVVAKGLQLVIKYPRRVLCGSRRRLGLQFCRRIFRRAVGHNRVRSHTFCGHFNNIFLCCNAGFCTGFHCKNLHWEHAKQHGKAQQ